MKRFVFTPLLFLCLSITVKASQPSIWSQMPNADDQESNTTFALDDFIETDPNTPISGNVLDNDYDLEGDTQTVTNPGVYPTTEGGQLVIAANGTYTYTPPLDFNGIDSFDYTVCDNGTPQACADVRLTIGVGVCTVQKNGEKFEWKYAQSALTNGTVLTQTMTQPASDYGFVFDVYQLDNSFNMEINGTRIAEYEIQFQSNGTSGVNVQFADGTKYEDDGRNIYKLIGDEDNPTIRIIISPSGSISLYGSKTSKGPLFPLVLTENVLNDKTISGAEVKKNHLNRITWHTDASNEIVVTQTVHNETVMSGYGYGQIKEPCPNYWLGGTVGKINAWNEPKNWTYNIVPTAAQDVVFATQANNPTKTNKPKSGPAKEDLHLDNANQNGTGGRVIGNLINDSDKNLVITTGNQLTINGEVKDENPDAGTIVVKADPTNTKPNGTLIFSDPSKNTNVQANVEFYNKAYDCADCGYYRKSWQYFGIPIVSGDFPVDDVTGNETINQWIEPFNGNKWQPAPYAPDTELMAFKGYEMTNDVTTQPTGVYSFKGMLKVGDAILPLTKTDNVNYSGTNLIGNSFTAAIPINSEALQGDFEKTVYLFNTGTRDQWRKLNGSSVSASVAGQYLAVPLNVAGQEGMPTMIPSTHAFMVMTKNDHAELIIDYSKLTKNQLTEKGIATRSVETTTTTGEGEVKKLPSILMDVMGQGTADRVWIFSEKSATYGFDDGWDGKKMAEDSSTSQLYVAATDSSKLQVATVPSMDKVEIGFIPASEGEYTLEFAFSSDLNKDAVYLNDLVTGTSQLINSGDTYKFEAKKGQATRRFSLSYKAGSRAFSADEALIDVTAVEGKIKITNGSKKSLSAQLSDAAGKFVKRLIVKADSDTEVDGLAAGTYIIRLQNATLNDVRRVTLSTAAEN